MSWTVEHFGGKTMSLILKSSTIRSNRELLWYVSNNSECELSTQCFAKENME